MLREARRHGVAVCSKGRVRIDWNLPRFGASAHRQCWLVICTAASSDYLKYISMMANGGVFQGKQIIKEEIAAIQFQNRVPGLGLEAFEERLERTLNI